MAFTALLGTIDSYPGNIVLGYGALGAPPAIERFASNTLSLQDVAGRSVIFDRSINHTLTFVGAAYRNQVGIVNHTLTFTQDASNSQFKFGDGSSLLVLSQSALVETILNRSLISTLVLNSTASNNINRTVQANNTLTFNQSAVGNNTKSATNTIVFNQTASAFVSKHAVSTLILTQSIDRSIVANRSLFSNFIPFQIVTLGPNTFRRSISHTLTFNQTATVNNVNGVNQTIVFTQSATANVSKPAINTLGLTHSLNLISVYNRIVTDQFVLVHSLIGNISKSAAALNVLAFVQNARGSRVHSESVLQTLIITQDLVRERFPIVINQTLTLNHVAACSKISTQSIVQSLILSQTMGSQNTLVRGVTSTLVFSHGRNQYIGLGGIDNIFVPSPQGIIVKDIVTLYGSDRSIVLPPPEFNDGDSFSGRLNIVRFAGGAKRIYKKDSEKYKHTYDFILDYHKVRELRLFIDNYNSQTFRIQNHKGEVWLVVFANNPFEYTEAAYWGDSCGNKFTISLEFEGVRLY